MNRNPQLLEKLAASPSHQARLLAQLLQALSWPGEGAQLRNALCGSAETLDGTDLLNTLANLGYRWDVQRISAADASRWQGLSFPVLLRHDRGAAALQLSSCRQDLEQTLRVHGQQLIYQLRFEPERSGEQGQWFQAQVLRFRRSIAELYLISLLINLLALALPFYIRAVYNLEIPGGQVGDLLSLLPFALLAVTLQIGLSQRRQQRLALIGGQLDLVLITRVLNRVLRLRLPQLERYTAQALAARLHGHQALRSYVTGPFALAALDLPFIGIYLSAIAAISLPLMGLTVLMVLICFGGVWLLASVAQSLQRPLQRNRSDLEPILLDLIENLDQVKASGSERIWQERLEAASADQASQGIGSGRIEQWIGILTAEFSQLTGALVLAVGAGLALAGEGLELGTLIAAMFFVWRVFRPIQMAYQALRRWPQMRGILEQLNRFMSSAEVEEDNALTRHWILPKPTGALSFKNVNLRLNAIQEPALSQVNLSIGADTLVAISGAEGAGSSSLLKLIDAQIPAGGGVISLDGADLRQLPLAQLRQAVVYVPETAGLFPGSLRENLLLADPLLADASLTEVLIAMGVGELLEREGLDRTVSLRGPEPLLPHQVQAVALARVLLADPKVLLLDQPFTRLRAPNRRALLQILERRRGHGTTLVASDDPELLTMADQIVLLREGTVAFSGSPADLLKAQRQAQAAAMTGSA
jgi:ABC-type bacteriocin/lantibiotic exporter with double-glycine peptidase domain